MDIAKIQERMDRAREHLENAQAKARNPLGGPQNAMVWLLDGICKAGAELLTIPAQALIVEADKTPTEVLD